MYHDEGSVDERLEKARLLPRTPPAVLTLVRSVDQLLRSQHQSNLTQALIAVHELAREHMAVIIALKWAVVLVDLLEVDSSEMRLGACNALAAVSTVQEGRDAIRAAGGLRPLALLLAEGSRSATAAAAALTLMNCSACDTCKEAIADCRGVPQMLGLLKEAVARCPPPGRGHGQQAQQGQGGPVDLKAPGDCKAAVYAAGALLNMGGVPAVQNRMREAGAVAVLEDVLRVSPPSDTLATRAAFILSWLAVGEGGAAAGPDAARAGPVPGRQGPLVSPPTPPQQRRDSSTGVAATPPRTPPTAGAAAAGSLASSGGGGSTPRRTGAASGAAASPAPSGRSTPAGGGLRRESGTGGASGAVGCSVPSGRSTPAGGGQRRDSGTGGGQRRDSGTGGGGGGSGGGGGATRPPAPPSTAGGSKPASAAGRVAAAGLHG